MKKNIKMKELLEKVNQMMKPYIVYAVGGCVRDSLLDKEPKDYDFCTLVEPDEIIKCVKSKSRRAYLTGKRFGTIGCKIDGVFIEITTFRSEKYEPKNRKPIVDFVKDIQEDLSRRDFTINAIAKSHKIIDPFNGRQDLKDKLIRAVGNPTIRFKEDPLRLLRACRFSSQLGFNIEEKTFKSMCKNAHKILDVSRERWVMELDKLLLGDSVEKGLNLLWESGLMKFMIPELWLQYKFDQRTVHHDFVLHVHTIKVVEATPKDIELRWSALLHDIAKPFVYQDKGDRYIYPLHEVVGPELIEKIGKYLKWSNERREAVKDIVSNHLKDESPLRQYDNVSKLLFKNDNEHLNKI